MTDSRFIIVRRGHFATFELLNRMFAGDPNVQIIWDRRIRERRQAAPPAEYAGLRKGDRRRKPPTQWALLNYMRASEFPASA
jgi:hypothetical protein